MTEPVLSGQQQDTCPGQGNDRAPGTIDIGINQVEYSNTPDGPLIHIFGRDAGGQAVHLQVTGFKPYFYAPADEVDGKPLAQSITPDTENTYYLDTPRPVAAALYPAPGGRAGTA